MVTYGSAQAVAWVGVLAILVLPMLGCGGDAKQLAVALDEQSYIVKALMERVATLEQKVRLPGRYLPPVIYSSRWRSGCLIH